MGQRLIINIKNKEDDEDILLSLYYHWSAYTRDALYLTKSIGDLIKKEQPTNKIELIHKVISKVKNYPAKVIVNKNEITEEVEKIIEELTKLGHKFTSDDKAIFEEGAARSEGLIKITKEGHEHNMEWCEGEVSIILEEDKIFFDVLTIVTPERKLYDEIKKSNKFYTVNGLDEFDPCQTDWDGINKFYEIVFNEMKHEDFAIYNVDQDLFYVFV